MTKRFGFTLAEVLITLTIIGVIAAMTIPTLLSNTSDQEYKTGLKKAISTLNQAITMQYALDGTNMSDFTASGAQTVFTGTYGVVKNVFTQRLQIISTTTSRGTKGFGGNSANAAIYLSDGMAIEIPTTALDGSATKGSGMSTDCERNKYSTSSNGATTETGCLYTIIVDTNGDKGTCQVSSDTTVNDKGKVTPKDCFPVDVYADGVRPANYVGRAIMYEGK